MAIINRLKGASLDKLMYLWVVFAESILGYSCFVFALDDMTK